MVVWSMVQDVQVKIHLKQIQDNHGSMEKYPN